MAKLLFIVIPLCWLSPVWAEEPVVFRNRLLKHAVEGELWISDPTPSHMLELASFRVNSHGIDDLTGLEYATNLSSLSISHNQITDVSPLTGLTNLQTLSANNNQIADISALAGLLHLEDLDIHENRISDISSLSGLTNLRYLNIHDNQISDISPLSGLTNLQTLVLSVNRIGGISPLSGLTNLEELHLDYNHITDVSALAGLTNLKYLNLEQNQIWDISPLTALTSLQSLNLLENPWSAQACYVYLPQIQANNPGIRIHDSYGPFTLSVSPTVGGSVPEPGVGDFTYDHGQTVSLRAQADPLFQFVNWSGSYRSSSNPVLLTIEQDHQIRANFISTLEILYVDNDAPEPSEMKNGTPEHPFETIQEAIEVAAEGASIVVRPGTYRENLRLLGKNLRLLGVDLETASGGPWVVLEGQYAGPVVSFRDGEGPDCLLSRFVVTRGRGQPAAAILCDGASPTIANCLIAGNRCTGATGAAIQCTRSSATFLNCTIADNYGGPQGAGLLLVDSPIRMTNSILWGNLPEEVLSLGDSVPSIRYCDVRGWWPEVGDLNVDPLFAQPGLWANPKDPNEILTPQDERAIWTEGDYHLKSQAGRWDPAARAWVQDEASSPCLDRGDPATPVGYEAAPNGGRLNLGAYGGTTQASKSAPPAQSP